MKNLHQKVQEFEFTMPQIQINQTEQNNDKYSDYVLQVLELEVLFKNQKPNTMRKLSLKFQQDGKAFYQNFRLIKQNKDKSRYVIIDQDPFNLNQNSKNDLILEVCSYEQKKEETWDRFELFKLLQEHEEEVNYNKFKDFWQFRYLNDPLDREVYHYGFVHIVIYNKQNRSYFDYIQSQIKDNISFVCPLYKELIYYPCFQPQQILLVYKLLSEFNYEWRFQGFYKYQVIENDYTKILNLRNNTVNSENQKQYQEYYAKIKTFYQFMYISQMTNIMSYYSKIQNYLWQYVQQNFKDVIETSKQAYLQDLQQVSQKIGISIKYRFQTWNEFALLNEKIVKFYKLLVKNYQKIELFKEYKQFKLSLIQQYGDQYELIEERCVEENKDFVYNIISTICHFHCIHVTPQMLYDLNQRFEQGQIDLERLSERFNLIAQVIKDIIFIYTFQQEIKKKQLDDLKTKLEGQQIKEKDYQDSFIVSQINYHQGLIDIIDKLITLNQTCKSNSDQKGSKFLSNIFWTLSSFYKHVLKYYICSKYRGKHIIDDLFILNYCIKVHMKDIWDHLDSLHINTDFLFEKSFFSLYANVFSRELLYRIWDIIFLEISPNKNKIKPRWILIAIAMTILFKIKNTLKQAQTVDDVLLLIKNYCLFETNISEFIDAVYEWVDKLFLQRYFDKDCDGEDYESQRYQDEYIIEKILIQESVMKGFYSKFQESNTTFEDQYLQKLRNVCFSKYFLLYETLKSEYQNIMDKKQSMQPLYQFLTNQPQKVHLVIHDFSELLLDQNDIIIKYFDKKFNVQEYLEFDLNEELNQQKLLGNLEINIKEQNVKYVGYIQLDSLFFDQAIKLNVLMEENKDENLGKNPAAYFLECSILIQTCNTHNLNYSKSQRVAFPYFKNLGKKITEDQKNQQYIVDYVQKDENSNKVEALVFSPMYSNEKFYSELNISEYKSKFDTCNYNMFTQWKINSYISNDVNSFIDKLFQTELSRQEKRDLIQQLIGLDNQFYILDLFLICIIYSQEQFMTKASLIFKYLNFFERRSSETDISDVTVKSFLVSLYERMQYYFPSHQVMSLENYYKSKAVSQINKVVYQYANGLEDLTSFFKEKIFDQVFEKNLSLNIDLSNPDFLKFLFMKLIQCNILIGGKLIIEYQLKTFKRQKELIIYYDELKQTFSLSNDFDNEQVENVKQQPLIQRLLQQQKHLINFEVYDTYTESEFINLLNQMPLVPLLLTIKNVKVDSPLVIENNDLSFGYLCRNFNIQLDVKICTENQLLLGGENFLVRDLFFNSRRDLLYAQDGQVPFKKYVFLPNINMYNRVQNIAENIVQALLNENFYVKQVAEVDGNNYFRILRYFALDKQLFQIDQLSKQLENQVLRVLDLPDIQKWNSQQYLNKKILNELKPRILSLMIKVGQKQENENY
ncbi:hypothetical protein ABPG74_020080 [Tetrahymena malaccensis]